MAPSAETGKATHHFNRGCDGACRSCGFNEHDWRHFRRLTQEEIDMFDRALRASSEFLYELKI